MTSPQEPQNGNGNGHGHGNGNGNGAGRPAADAAAGHLDGATSGDGAGNGTTPVVKAPQGEARAYGPRAMIGMPVERSENFAGSTRRLISMLRPERFGMIFVMLLAVVSVTFSVFGPKILGHGTDIIIAGLYPGSGGIDFNQLADTLLLALGLYVLSAVMSYTQAWLLAGAVQRTMSRLRADVEDKLNRLPLGYVDRQPRGDLLSRVTNDIDNVAQSLQQSLSMMLTSTLTIIGTVIMMLIISPLLSLVLDR